MGRQVIEKNILAGKRLGITIKKVYGTYVKLAGDKKWKNLELVDDTKSIKRWIKFGVPIDKINNLASFFKVPPKYFTDDKIPDDEFEEKIRLAKDTDSPYLLPPNWIKCSFCDRNSQNVITCPTCQSRNICLEHCFNPVTNSCEYCKTTNTPQEAFKKLRNTDNGFSLEVEIEKIKSKRRVRISPDVSVNANQFKIYDCIGIKLSCKKAGYFYIFNIKPSGNIALLYPVNSKNRHMIMPGDDYKLPGNDRDWVLKGPPGDEIFKIIITENRLEILHKTLEEPKKTDIFIYLSSDLLEDLIRTIKKLDKNEWTALNSLITIR